MWLIPSSWRFCRVKTDLLRKDRRKKHTHRDRAIHCLKVSLSDTLPKIRQPYSIPPADRGRCTDFLTVCMFQEAHQELEEGSEEGIGEDERHVRTYRMKARKLATLLGRGRLWSPEDRQFQKSPTASHSPTTSPILRIFQVSSGKLTPANPDIVVASVFSTRKFFEILQFCSSRDP